MIAVLRDTNGKVRGSTSAPSWCLSNNKSVLLWLELHGPMQLVRAIWANLVKGRKGSYTVRTEVTVEEGGRKEELYVLPVKGEYFTVQLQGIGLVVAHKEFNRLNGNYVIGGDEITPSPWFVGNMARLAEGIPYKTEWATAMWREGVHRGVITHLTNSAGPMNFWSINAQNRIQDWTTIIKNITLFNTKLCPSAQLALKEIA